jgi:hypothetical protein
MLPPVVAELKASIEGFKSKMSEARKEMQDTESAGKSHFGGLGLAAAGGLAAVGGAAVAFAGDSIKTYSDLAGQVSKLERLTGEGAQSMSRLAFEAQESGVSADGLNKAILRLSKGAAANSKAFEEHGIATRDAQGHMLSMSQILGNAADVFAKMPDGVEKNALAMQLFGRTGADLIPMLNKGSAGLKELGDEADKFGVTIGQDGVDSMRKNTVAQRQMHAAMEGIKVQIGQYLLPVVAKLTGWLAEHMPAAVAVVKRVMQGLQPVFHAIGEVVSWLAGWIRNHWDTIKADVQKAINFVRQVIETTVQVIKAIWSHFGDNIMSVIEHAWSFIKGIVQAAMEFIHGIIEVITGIIHGDWGKVWNGIKDIFGGVWDAIKSILSEALNLITNLLSAAWKVIKAAVSAAWHGLVTVISNNITTAVDFVKGLPKKMLDGLSNLAVKLYNLAQSAMQYLWNGLQDAWNAGWSFITGIPGKIGNALSGFATKLWNLGSDAIKSLWDGMKSAWNWLADKATFKLPKIHILGVGDIGGGTISILPHLAKGGVLTGPTMFVGGEYPGAASNPEIVTPEELMRQVVRDELSNAAPQGPGLQQVNNFYGITDHHELARKQSAETAWAMKTWRG